ncbi:hypothetical protein D9758_008085 [Tetrapyrgos nigripes]|uniref:non-specific serine/threonine protein kinase n=1 Tax=Tetrapyrgos nigripes TaxID=182062 RepID=A0A8H5GH28_9AGAR|nr:hypothetical protein D9758_008085 [Tetrapyrgos nigripes]
MPSKKLASCKIPEYLNYLLPIPENPLHFVELLGIGAFGKVYRANAIPLHSLTTGIVKQVRTSPIFNSISEPPKTYAVKCLLKPAPGTREEQAYFFEIRNHKAVSSHPNIVSLIDSVHSADERVSPAQNYGFIVLEHCDAGDLLDALGRRVFDRDDEAIKNVFLQILDAVDHCHQHGVFHRDLKPENVLLCSDGSARIADFGLSTTNRWSERFHCGSANYMSPECLHGPGFESLRYSTLQNDIWSLGIILTNLLLNGGTLWHEASLDDERFAQYVNDPRRCLSKWSSELSDEAIDILLGVLNTNLLSRTPLAVLRDEVREVKTFFKTKVSSFLDIDEDEQEQELEEEQEQKDRHSTTNISISENLDSLLDIQLKVDVEVEVRVDVKVEVQVQDERGHEPALHAKLAKAKLEAQANPAKHPQCSQCLYVSDSQLCWALSSPETSSTAPSYSSSFETLSLESSECLHEMQKFETEIEEEVAFVMESRARKDAGSGLGLTFVEIDLSDSKNLKML